MKRVKYYISLFCPLLLMAVLTVVFRDTEIFLTFLLYVTIVVECIENPVKLESSFKKSQLPEWVATSRKRFHYWGWLVAVIVFCMYLVCTLPENVNEYTGKDCLVLAVFFLFAVVAGLMRRSIVLQNAPEDLDTMEDLLQSIEDEENANTYMSVKSFNTVEEAEAFGKELEDAGIPSMIYGANRPEYIPSDALPIRVMVRKRYSEAVARHMENRKS